MSTVAPTPVLFIQPQGLTVTGITTWAVRMSSALARSGQPVGLAVHGSVVGHCSLDADIDPLVRTFRDDSLPPIDALSGDVSPVAAFYAKAVDAMGGAAARPVVLIPTRHGDCFGACAELTRTMPDRVRVIGWQHVASPYEDALIARYEPSFSRLVGVSSYLAERFQAVLPGRAHEVCSIPNAVDVPPEPLTRKRNPGEPIRLLYTGRIEHEQKRVRALVSMSDELTRRGLAHELTFLGDGPASGEIDQITRTRPAIRRLDPVAPSEIGTLYDRADLFVLSSRTEGLSVSLLEAMARGCVPVITHTDSGSGEVVLDGDCGVLVPFAGETDEQLGLLMAGGVERALAIGLGTLARRAHKRVLRHFARPLQVERTIAVIEAAGESKPRRWAINVPPAFSAEPGAVGSGSVPADGARRMAQVLEQLAGQKLIIHGTGQHTRQLRAVIERSPAEVIAFADDDPAKCGGVLWGRPIVGPEAAGSTGAAGVVISSWIHEGPIWDARGVYERQGLIAHRVYAPKPAAVPV